MSLNNPKSLYDKILQAEKSSTIQDIVNKENSKQIRVHMPCKVVAVHGSSVDVEIQGKEDTGYGTYSTFPPLLNLPIIYNNYTSKAYIVTPIQVGDTGLVEFLDFNTTNFNNNGNTELTSDTFYHSINNGSFINGFIPSSKQIDIPEGYPLVIGLKNKTFTFTVDETGSLNINSNSEVVIKSDLGITLDSPKVDVSGDISIGNGASGSFTTGNGETVTVAKGIITKIGE